MVSAEGFESIKGKSSSNPSSPKRSSDLKHKYCSYNDTTDHRNVRLMNSISPDATLSHSPIPLETDHPVIAPAAGPNRPEPMFSIGNTPIHPAYMNDVSTESSSGSTTPTISGRSRALSINDLCCVEDRSCMSFLDSL